MALLVPAGIAVTRAHVAALPDLRIVAATSTGYDQLDLAAIAQAGAWATCTAGYCDEEVADHALAFIVDLLRGVTLLDRSVRAGAWSYQAARPRRITGTLLGIVGLGRIGSEVARRALALGMRVRAYDPVIAASAFVGLAVERTPDLPTLLGAAEVVSLHAPLTPATSRLIDSAALAAMKPGAYLVNCARAGLVDHAALGEAMRSGHLGGCALDVLPHEPPAADEPALAWPRTLLNPHAAWYSPGSATEPYRRATKAVLEALDGREPDNAVAGPTRTRPQPRSLPRRRVQGEVVDLNDCLTTPANLPLGHRSPGGASTQR